MQFRAIFQVTGERLSLFGMAQVDHVPGKGVLGLALLGTLLVLNLKKKKVHKMLDVMCLRQTNGAAALGVTVHAVCDTQAF